ncbi:MAG TPA: isoprenoid biosynthesis glyoxalase ElbB [Marinilabiliaceae bacterium]|nr:isoprenoid biosynthesis glyoxalase ElbB [Marinilabiliaceae bacterium]
MSEKKNIAVVLSGCGAYDGAEIHESVFTLWAIAKAGFKYEIFAPDIEQHHVINHLTGQETKESRNVLVESARIARGDIKSIANLNSSNFDAVIFPGGFGVAKNLCSYAFEGIDCKVNPEVESIIRKFHSKEKPIGALCISPVMVAQVLKNLKITIGSDTSTIEAIEKMGNTHIESKIGEVIIDRRHKVASTPCYMLDSNILQIAESATKIVDAVIELIREKGTIRL